jgi:transposase
MILPFMPERRRFGRRRSTKLRAVVEAMFYIASTGCQWRQLLSMLGAEKSWSIRRP